MPAAPLSYTCAPVTEKSGFVEICKRYLLTSSPSGSLFIALNDIALILRLVGFALPNAAPVVLMFENNVVGAVGGWYNPNQDMTLYMLMWVYNIQYEQNHWSLP